MQPRLSLVTLGVADIARARKFYTALGFRASSASTDDVVFFPAGGVALALFGRRGLAEDANVADSAPVFSGVVLAHNVASEPEVEDVLAHAARAGARITKPAQKAFWGGYTGCFADPDGHLWEVAYNPGFPLDGEGRITLPPPDPAA